MSEENSEELSQGFDTGNIGEIILLSVRKFT